MAGLIDPGEDFTVVDALETVTYFRRTGNSTFDSGTACANVLRRDVSRQEVEAGGASLVVVKTRFHVWKADLESKGPAPDPKVNDVIQDAAGRRWSVVEVDEGTLQTRWRLTTVQER